MTQDLGVLSGLGAVPLLEHLALNPPAAEPWAGGASTLAQVRWMLSESMKMDELRRRAIEATDEHFGRRRTLFGPVYLLDQCINDCGYCGYRRGNDERRGAVIRRRANLPEVVEQARDLVESGRRSVLLIGGEIPERQYIDDLEAAVRAVRALPGSAEVMTEFAPMSDEALRRLLAAGATTSILFQETYDRAVYERPDIHPQGDPKGDFERRVSAPGQAAYVGFPNVNLGVLYGLAEPGMDTVSLIAHARWLRSKWPQTRVRISVPRFKRALGARFEHAPFEVTDGMFERVVYTIRCALPEAQIALTAREPAALRNRLFPVTTMLGAGGRTSVGSYNAAFDPLREQFLVEDTRSFEEVRAHLIGEGYALS